MSRRMSMRDAMSLVPDDLPDGAFWAMAHEMAGLEYGDGFDELICEAEQDERVVHDPTNFGAGMKHSQTHKSWRCCECHRRFRSKSGAEQHWQVTHGARHDR